MRNFVLVLALVAALASIPLDASEEYRPFGSGAKVTDTPVSPDGTVVLLDLAKELHIRNVGGSDRAGLCVFSSINHAAYWQNVPELWDFQKWMRSYPGGAGPSKVDTKIREICRQKGFKEPRYVQVESADISIHELMCRTGRMPSVTLYYSPARRYGGARILHMVTLLHADAKWVCILDNNFPGTYEWVPTPEWPNAYTDNGRVGWTVALLNPGPPPCPK